MERNFMRNRKGSFALSKSISTVKFPDYLRDQFQIERNGFDIPTKRKVYEMYL